MRHLVWLVLVVGCDHRPSPAPAAKPVAVPDAAVVIDAAPIDVSEACTEVGVKVAAIWVDSAATPTEKAQLEQERTRIVRTMSENCARSKWSDAARTCMLAATTRGGLQQCQQLHLAAGSGS